MNYLLDTNVISELIAKHPNPRVVEWIDALDADSIYLSVITIGELSKEIEKFPESPRKTTLRNWLTTDLLLRFRDRTLVLDVDVMLTWGMLTGQLERAGRPSPAIDSLIAALALHYGYTLVTRNHSDFDATGVQVLNPWNLSGE